ncbi:hypothetical protein FNV62_43060 [Streptomyces sp. RLB3-17]|uniref:hypothetical protein n=1 Tax=unclassified Streptomyces TaxID=2593676 RepID=UPI0011623458|nr:MULTISPECIES: hypothetical protein [unclassified Streptomyces]NMI62370.1 hypothetical protein [Streptomyces sp. RLA2-12]QDN61376.1 hypothetical protein FNV67_44290 [Streptomyces sp. S1D4-20]QDN71429.1 hypothetical protein FNV66_43140 [Streptomyces sp. S1D4-14]QDO43970.1 hypothetical protein FNV62_43060 [Streptomyces sp. RLB3-17]QDO53885.1 hypothetical protein FNV60_41620 [Streptomyces sp. RLB3-5]
MTAHHAIEIVLTRPATVEELPRAHSAARLAANTDRTRLLALQRAKSPGRALRALRRQLDALLPIDVLTSHYPDQYGQVLLNLTLSNTARTAIRRAAATRGQRPQDFLSHSVAAAVARHEQQRRRHLTAQLEGLLVHHSPEEVLTCAADALLGHRHHRVPTKR